VVSRYQLCYSKVYVHSDSAGCAWIEWDNALQYDLGEKYPGSLSASNQIEMYYVILYTRRSYEFRLTVPAGGDFDLYLYHLEDGQAANASGYVTKSETAGAGVAEVISPFETETPGTWAVLVVRSSGEGAYEFYITYAPAGDGIPVLPWVLLGTAVAGITVAALFTRRTLNQRKSPEYLAPINNTKNYHNSKLQETSAEPEEPGLAEEMWEIIVGRKATPEEGDYIRHIRLILINNKGKDRELIGNMVMNYIASKIALPHSQTMHGTIKACPQCGLGNAADEAFCTHCGTEL
jgi:hypothetical protein